MKAHLTHRTTCRLCDSPNLERVLKLEPIPLSENYCDDGDTGKQSERYPVDIYMCEACGHVQQLDVIDAESLWENYTYCSADANGMPEHFKGVVDKLVKHYTPSSGSLVIDIGSNDGSLLRPFKEEGFSVLGIDPAREIAKKATDSGILTIPELLSLSLAKDIFNKYGGASVVCMFNAFAHADNMQEVAESIKTLLSPDGIFVFEAQYLLDVIDNVLIATIFHEHMSHHSVVSLVYFFDRHGLELINVERVPIQHGSIVGIVQIKGGGRTVSSNVIDLLALEKMRKIDKLESMRSFSSHISELKTKIQSLVNVWHEEKAIVVGYGAARSGPTLIAQFGLADIIQFIVDDHPQKVHKYSSGDGIKIVPTGELLQKMPNYTVILAWVHAAKIISNNREYLERGGKFVVLCPRPRIVSIDGEFFL